MNRRAYLVSEQPDGMDDGGVEGICGEWKAVLVRL
ncbi:hypothetical protein SAMN05518865_106304 [Duganella sp. CF458]|nr:hypothetical protein SAMN05518865_106304 [Duganella sp. CF458]